jgi:hypothetical protein
LTPTWLKRALGAALLLYLGLVAAGVLTVALRRPVLTARPGVQGVARPGDLAGPGSGAWVTASSAHARGLHHPIFAIDGRTRAPKRLKWASDPSDPAPWIELHLPKASRLEAVTLHMAGTQEHTRFNMDYYDITCSLGGQPVHTLAVRGNELSVPTHALDCPRADALKVRFYTYPSGPREIVRLYEVKLKGAPL